jgi:hypothetical protein
MEQMGIAIIGLLPEINTIFIHARLVLKFWNMQDTQLYRINQALNIGTFYSPPTRRGEDAPRTL